MPAFLLVLPTAGSGRVAILPSFVRQYRVQNSASFLTHIFSQEEKAEVVYLHMRDGWLVVDVVYIHPL